MSPTPLLVAALILGVLEGLTEFVPVSSTGHLIVAGKLLGMDGELGPAFEIFIQLGAIAAVIWYYRSPLIDLGRKLPAEAKARSLVAKLLLAFCPAAIAGLALNSLIVSYLFSPGPVAFALIFGGLVLIGADGPTRGHGTAELSAITWRQALAVGLAQVVSLWPGVSRSGATIVGGLLAGMSRSVALEFSFYLAIPTMVAACLYSLFQARALLDAAAGIIFAVGFFAAFLSALLVVHGLIALVRRRDLRPFGWYRIIAGSLLILWEASL